MQSRYVFGLCCQCRLYDKSYATLCHIRLTYSGCSDAVGERGRSEVKIKKTLITDAFPYARIWWMQLPNNTGSSHVFRFDFKISGVLAVLANKHERLIKAVISMRWLNPGESLQSRWSKPSNPAMMRRLSRAVFGWLRGDEAVSRRSVSLAALQDLFTERPRGHEITRAFIALSDPSAFPFDCLNS